MLPDYWVYRNKEICRKILQKWPAAPQEYEDALREFDEAHKKLLEKSGLVARNPFQTLGEVK